MTPREHDTAARRPGWAERAVPALAGLWGAAGVALAAAGAHMPDAANLPVAAWFLLIHAGAALAALALAATRTGAAAGFLRAGACFLLAGPGLFAGDLAAGELLASGSLFPMAAPLGGTTTIAGWLALAGAALGRRPAPR